MTSELYEELTDILAAARESRERLTAKDWKFVDDMQERADQWNERIMVSDKQWKWLRDIQEKL